MKRLLLFASVLMGTGLTAQINTFPWTEDFESQANGPTGCGPTYNFAGTTWQNGDDVSLTPAIPSHQVDWTVDEGGTSSSATGPSVDHTLGTSAGHYIYTETSCSGTGYSNREFNIKSPYLDFTALSGVELNFWHHAYGGTMGNLTVLVDVNGSGVWTTVGGPYTDNIDLWQERIVSLNAYAGMDSVRVRFQYVSGTSFTGDCGLDDISIFQPDPYQLTLASVDTLPTIGCSLGTPNLCLSIVHSGGTAYMPGDTLTAGYMDDSTTINESFTLLDTLNPGDTLIHCFSTPADFTAAGIYNWSSWFGSNQQQLSSHYDDTLSGTVQVLPSISIMAGVPYRDDFESGQTWSIDNTTNGATNGSWAFGTPAGAIINSAASDTTAFMTGNLGATTYNSGENSFVTSGCFDFTNANGDEWVGMNVWWESEISWDGAALFYTLDGGTVWNRIGSFGDPHNWYTDNTINGNPGGQGEGWTGRDDSGNGSGGWVFAKHELDSAIYGAPSVIFRVYFGSDGSVQDEGFAFDDFTIASPPAPVMDSMNLEACGDTAVYPMLDTNLYHGFQWSTGATTASDTINASGQYWVMFNDSMDMCRTDTFTVGIYPNYIAPVLPADSMICPGDSVAYMVGFDSSMAYMWSTGSTSNMATLMTGTGWVTAMDTSGACSMSDSITLTNPTAVASVGPDTAFCDGGSYTLNAGVNNGTYSWSTGDTTMMTTVMTTGTVSVDVIDSIGCLSSDSAVITVHALPTPSITGTPASDTLCESGSMTLDAGAGFNSYSWSTGGSSQTEALTGAGLGQGMQTIIVTVVDGNGCSGMDTVMVFVDPCVGIDDIPGLSMSIYPNPSNGLFNYTFSNMPGAVNLTVTDVTGKVVISEQITQTVGTIDLTTFEKGVYMLNIEHNGQISTTRLMKQ